jgi:HlyD family type I secretion membrane fusion protein
MTLTQFISFSFSALTRLTGLIRPAPLARPRQQTGVPVVPDDASGSIRAGYGVIAFFFGGLGLWSALAPVAGAAIAPGFVKVEGNRQSLQHRYGGTVRQILVKDGDQVTRGQVLIRLDDINARARADSLAAMHDALKAAEGRLIAERDGSAEPAFGPSLLNRGHEPAVAGAIANQIALLRSRRDKHEAEIGVLRQRKAQLREQITGARIQAEAADRKRDLIREELAGTRELYEKGYSPKTRVLALERSEAELMSDGGARRADIAKFDEAIGQADLEIAKAEHARLSEVTDQLRETQTKLAELEPQLQDARDVLERTELVAPASGEVVGLKVFTEGGVIAPGTTLLDIVPSKGNLVFEARVKPLDVHDVANDARADVRLTGMIGRTHAALRGKVKTISADRLEDSRSGQPYFVAAVEIDPQSLVQSGVTLQPGMPADILITTKPRSVLQYIISPLSDQMALGFREN